MMMPGLLSPSPDVNPDETSSLAEDSVHELDEMKEDTNVFETQDELTIYDAPVHIDGRGAARVLCGPVRH